MLCIVQFFNTSDATLPVKMEVSKKNIEKMSKLKLYHLFRSKILFLRWS